MNRLKKPALIFGLLMTGLLDISVYWNNHLYYRAGKSDDPEKKIVLLEKSNWVCPLNDLTFYELGKSYFDLGIGSLNDVKASELQLRESVRNLEKSLSINPASPFAHFQLAQSLLNLELVSSENDTRSYDEFRKAALLAGEDSQIFSEVGRLFLSRWPQLSGQERSLTREMLGKIMAKKDKERISLILNTWEMNAKDYQIIEDVLPEDAQVYRQFARFLGEKSLSLEKRHQYLVQAERLEFTAAQGEFQSGARDLSLSRVHGALSHFVRARELLREIRFHHAVSEGPSIPRQEFADLMKSLFLNLAKCRIENGESLKESVDYLRQYLDLEDQAANIGALESYLKDRRIIPAHLERNTEDLDGLSFELLLLFKQKKYDEIISFSRGLERGDLMVPKAMKKSYSRCLQVTGQSFLETGNLPVAEDFFRRAIRIDAGNIDALLGLRLVCRRLNDEKKQEEVDLEIEKVLTPKKVDFKALQLSKGQVLRTPLILDGQDIVLDIYFKRSEDEREPLLSICFNDLMIWDDYSPRGNVSIALRPKTGMNVLQITSVNGSLPLLSLGYRIIGRDNSLQDKEPAQ